MSSSLGQGLKVLGIAGSPRRGGNTDLLLGEVLAGAKQQGAEVKTIILNDLYITPCQHCDGCLETGECVYQDDMQEIYYELREADHIVLASPIFFMGLTAQTKAMIDRCQALWALKYVLKCPVAFNPERERQGFFVSVGGMGLRNLFEPAMATVRAFFKVLELNYVGNLLLPRIDKKGEIAQHPTALRDAFLVGQELAGVKLKEVANYGGQSSRGKILL